MANGNEARGVRGENKSCLVRVRKAFLALSADVNMPAGARASAAMTTLRDDDGATTSPLKSAGGRSEH